MNTNEPVNTACQQCQLDNSVDQGKRQTIKWVSMGGLTMLPFMSAQAESEATPIYLVDADAENDFKPLRPADLAIGKPLLVFPFDSKSGKPKNESVIRAIVDSVGSDIPVQIGGGIRDLDTIERYLDFGITYVIIGTAAVKNPGFLHDACGAFPGSIIVGLDARDGKVATDGWSKLTKHDVLDMAKKFEDYGCEAIIYTDIGRDGMLTGVNIEATVRLAQHVRIPVIASGGVTDMRDIEALCAVEAEGIEGAILGRSIYEGTLDFEAAQLRADELAP